MEVVASLSQGRTAAAQCGLFTHKSVPVIFEPPCIYHDVRFRKCKIKLLCLHHFRCNFGHRRSYVSQHRKKIEL